MSDFDPVEPRARAVRMSWIPTQTRWKDQEGISPDASCSDGVSRYRNLFGYTTFSGSSYDGRCSFFGQEPALPEEFGWFIVVGLGCFFACLTAFSFWISNRKSARACFMSNSEYFSTAGRTINSGLTAADLVTKWTWAATLLQSSNVAYQFGVSGPFWYASGATIQVLLFSILAIEIKRKCPAIHTVLEIVYVRWGSAAHGVFLFFCLSTNLIVTGMLILGGSAVVNALTGISTHAACFLIPLGVCTYTAFGGLKATYYASWTHTTIIHIVLLIFLWKVYVGPSDLGSTNRVWENLMLAAKRTPVEGNSNGSYLTMFSQSGTIFGVVNIVGNFGTVFVDQAYWQGAIACRPSATWRGYLLGGIAWFAIPFAMATTLGLAARALDLPITIDESRRGLLPPAVAVHLLGKGGAFLVALQLFLAVTSTANSEQLAVSALFAYDVYKLYVNPHASGPRIILVSRIGVFVWAVLSGVFSVLLWECNISLDWLYKAMGNFIGSAVAPICMALLWKDCTPAGAIAGAVLGMMASLAGWIGVALRMEGSVTVESLGKDYPMLTGNLLALLVSPLVAVTVSQLQGGQGFDWCELESRTAKLLVEDDPNAFPSNDESEDSKQAMDRVYSSVVRVAVSLSVVLVVAWPLLTLPQDPFSKAYFAWWVALAFIWGHAAAFITVIYPVWEARSGLAPTGGLKTASNDMDLRLRLVRSLTSDMPIPPLDDCRGRGSLTSFGRKLSAISPSGAAQPAPPPPPFPRRPSLPALNSARIARIKSVEFGRASSAFARVLSGGSTGGGNGTASSGPSFSHSHTTAGSDCQRPPESLLGCRSSSMTRWASGSAALEVDRRPSASRYVRAGDPQQTWRLAESSGRPESPLPPLYLPGRASLDGAGFHARGPERGLMQGLRGFECAVGYPAIVPSTGGALRQGSPRRSSSKHP